MRTTLQVVALIAVTLFSGLVMGLAGAFLYLNPQVPEASTYRDIRLQTPLRIYSHDGQFIGEFGERRRIPLSIDEFPEPFLRAVLDTEDKRYYSHGGVDLITLTRAIINLVRSREIGAGGSTITMQLARNIEFGLEQTFVRKFKEIILAVKLEAEFTKDEILELYLNVIFLGKRAYGAEAAARTYYGRPLSELDIAQWAMIAGIAQAPSRNNPINGPEAALERRNLVLRRMRQENSIDQATFEAAVAQPITASLHDQTPELDAPWVAEWARQQTLALYGDAYDEDGLEVRVTIDSRLQEAAQWAVRRGLNAYDRRHGFRGPERMLVVPEDGAPLDEETLERWRRTLDNTPVIGDQFPALVTELSEDAARLLLASGEQVDLPMSALRWARRYETVNRRGPRPVVPADVLERGHLVRVQSSEEGWRLGQVPDAQSAFVAMDPANGAVRALVGGYDFGNLQFNHALQAARQPGSSFKPFIYTAALDSGRTPATLYLDAPLVFEDENLEGLYRPRNDSGDFAGPTRLRRALYRSVNLVSMRVLLDLGASNVIDYVTRFGFDTRTFPRNLQLAIGGGTMALTPIELATGYASFANGGFRVEPHLIDTIHRGEDEIFRARVPVACDSECLLLREEQQRQALAAAELELQAPGDHAELSAPLPEIAPRVLDERVAFLIHSMLGDVIQYGTGRRARSLERDDLGGKTGTTNEADTWFSGYQRSLAATVWLGFSDNRPVGENEFGSNAALPIWIDFMETALEGGSGVLRPFSPPGVVRMRIDPDTGLAVPPNSNDGIWEFFLADNAPEAASVEESAPVTRPESIF